MKLVFAPEGQVKGVYKRVPKEMETNKQMPEQVAFDDADGLFNITWKCCESVKRNVQGSNEED